MTTAPDLDTNPTTAPQLDPAPVVVALIAGLAVFWVERLGCWAVTAYAWAEAVGYARPSPASTIGRRCDLPRLHLTSARYRQLERDLFDLQASANTTHLSRATDQIPQAHQPQGLPVIPLNRLDQVVRYARTKGKEAAELASALRSGAAEEYRARQTHNAAAVRWDWRRWAEIKRATPLTVAHPANSGPLVKAAELAMEWARKEKAKALQLPLPDPTPNPDANRGYVPPAAAADAARQVIEERATTPLPTTSTRTLEERLELLDRLRALAPDNAEVQGAVAAKLAQLVQEV